MEYNIIVDTTTLSKLGRVGHLGAWEGLNSLIASNRKVIITTTILAELDAASSGAWGAKAAADWIRHHRDFTGLVKVVGPDFPPLGTNYGEASIQTYISNNNGDNFIVLIDEKPTKVDQYFNGDSYGAIPFTIDLFLSGGISFSQAVFNITQLASIGSGNPAEYAAEAAQFLALSASVVTDGEATFFRRDGQVSITISLGGNGGSITVTSHTGEVEVIGINDRFRVSEDGEITVNPDNLAEDHGLPLCFPAGTLISTPFGMKEIQSLLHGDLVFAFDPLADFGRGDLQLKRVVRLFHNETEEWLRLTWRESGEDRELTVTPGHRFLDAEGRFRRIDEIITDAAPTVVLADGSLAQVRAERIVWSQETRHMFEEAEAVAMAAGDGLAHRMGGAWRSYNFEVEDLHTYVAGGVRVHNDSQQTIDLAGNIGRTFGTMLAGVLLDGESQFTQVLGGTVLGTITENLAEIITDTSYHLFDGTQLNFGDAVETAMRQLDNIPEELLAGFASSISSLFMAELGEQLGLEGFGAQLFSTIGTTYLGSVAEQVSGNLLAGDDAFFGVDWTVPWEAVGGSIGVFFGSSLANELLPADTLEGSIGGSLGSLIGSSLGVSLLGPSIGSSLGVFANFLLPGIGSFLGTLLGTFLGDLFGDEPDPGADFWLFAEQQGEQIVPGILQYYLYAIARDGFPTETTRDLGRAVLDLSKDYMSNIGAFDMANANISNFTLPAVFQANDPNNLGSNPLIRVLQRMNVEVNGDGSLSFFVNGRQVTSAEAMVEGAVTDFLRDSQPIGGNIFLKRAVVNSAGDSSFTIASAMATATEYQNYLENREIINALLTGSENTAFAGAWAYVLAGAELLDLASTSESDFNGGLSGFIASLIDSGVAADFTRVAVSRGAGGAVFIDVMVDDASSIPSYIHLFSDGATVTPSGDGASIRFTFDSNMSGVGYNNLTTATQIGATARYGVNGETNGRDIWIASDNRNYDFVDVGTHTILVGGAEIESSDDIIIMGGGADSVQAGTGWDWISGGAGNDTLYGGDQDDTIFGGAGNDALYGGNQMDFLEGGAGADTISGAAPGQVLDPWAHATDYAIAGYTQSGAAVSINLGTGLATGGDATGDVLTNIIKLVGSDFNDSLVGDALPNWLEGGAGADTLDGGNDTHGYPDYVSYFHATAGVTASLADSSINSGDAEGDVYRNIEGLEGSNFSDTLIGDNGGNFLSGYAGDDILIAGAGADTIKGGFGFDVMSYRNLGSAIVIDLGNWASGSAVVADDVRFNQNSPSTMDIEAYEATDFNDTMRGSNLSDVLIGRAGSDSILGQDGSDALSGDHGNDTLEGGSGDDTLGGGQGEDRLYGGIGNDRLITGGGNLLGWSYLYGGEGDDTYLIAHDSGRTYISSLEGAATGTADKVVFEDVAFADVTFTSYDYTVGGTVTSSEGVALIIRWDTTDGTHEFRIANMGESIEVFEFADGTLMNGIQVAAEAGDTLTGGVGADYLLGRNGIDSLYGGDANDTLVGGAGADRLTGGNGTDLATYENALVGILVDLQNISTNTGEAQGDIYSSIENLAGSGGNDTLYADGNSNVLVGLSGNDVLAARGGNDTLDGGSGNDTLVGGLGADQLIGGVGVDLAAYWNSATGLRADLQASGSNTGEAAGDTYSGIENLAGTNSNDSLYGNEAANYILAFVGGDDVAGRGGNDTLDSGDGNDTLAGGAGADALIGGAGIDLAVYWSAGASVRADLQYASTNTGEATGDTYAGVENLYGSAFADILAGDTQANLVVGAAGNDALYGRDGNDTLQGGDGNDQLFGQVGNDALAGEAGNDTLDGGVGNDSLNGGLGADQLIGGEGVDLAVYWNASASVRADLQYASTNTGEAAGDTYAGVENLYGSAFADILAGDAQANTLIGYTGNDGLYGRDGNDILQGGDGNDQLFGQIGNDALAGEAGNDTLNGSTGNDSLNGGLGADAFVFNSTSSGVDVIADFNELNGGGEEGDVLRFEGLGVGAFVYLGTGAFTGGSNNSEARVSGSQVFVDTNGDGTSDITITLTGLTNASQLAASDFIFV